MKKIYRVFEEETNSNNSQTTSNQSLDANKTSSTTSADPQTQAKIAQLQQDITTLQGRLTALKRTYDQNVYNIRQQVNLLNKQITTLGGVPVQISESIVSYYKSKKLFESAQLSKADELCAAIIAANDKIETLSYHIDTKSAMLFARKILAFINDKYWNDGENHWDDIEEYFKSIIIKSSISLSRRELNQFLEEFKNILKENTTYRWIFGNGLNNSKMTAEQLSEGMFNRRRNSNMLDNLPDKMPQVLHNIVYNIAVEIKDDIADPTDEGDIYGYFEYATDDFWEAFDEIYCTDFDDDDYYSRRLDVMWNKWKDEIMDIMYDVYNE